MSVGEAKATIRQGLQSAEHSRTAIQAVMREAAEARDFAAQTLHDSRHEKVKQGLACLKAAEHELELTARRLKATVDAATSYLSALG
jgi:hypothetical protein